MFKKHKMKIVVLLFLTHILYADGINALKDFLSQHKNTIMANFTQTVFGIKKNRVSVGRLEIQRPYKFRWEYTTDGQIIISDGKFIYIYDQPLQQVTVKKYTTSFSKSPAILLAGGADIQRDYIVSNGSNRYGLEWVNLIPKNPADNNGFTSIAIAFSHNVLTQMNFIDTFNNKTNITFTQVKHNIAFASNAFIYTPKPNVDVLKEDN